MNIRSGVMKDEKENIKLDYINGMKQKDICDKYNISINTLKSWIKRYKWVEEKRNKGAPVDKKGAPLNNKSVLNQNLSKENKINDLYEVKEVLNNDKLTDKQKLFCIHYIKCFNATKAYQKAYGCSYNTAMVEGFKHLRNPKIEEEIERLKEAKLNKVMLSEDDIFQKYIDIAFADITDYVDFGTEEIETEEVSYIKNYIRFKQDYEVDGTLISEVSQGKDGVKIKLYDKMKALQWLSDKFSLDEINKLKVEKLRKEVYGDNKDTTILDSLIGLFNQNNDKNGET